MQILLEETSLASMIDFIVMVYHAPLRQNILHIEFETLQLVRSYSQEFPEMEKIGTLLTQFKDEVLPHMNREEKEFFPVLKQIEKCANGIEQFTDCDLKRFEDVIEKLEYEHFHFDNCIIELLKIYNNSFLKNKNMYVYDHFRNYFLLLENETMRHTQMENTKLHPLAKKLFKEVCNLS